MKLSECVLKISTHALPVRIKKLLSKLISAVAVFHRACLGQAPFLRNPYLGCASLRVNETVAFPIKI